MARSKEFDENAVLDKAMKLFWEQGYEKTSMTDLVECMGIHRRSLYDTFTDKHTLYVKAMERFGERMRSRWVNGINHAETAEQALRFVFNFVIEGEEDTPPGCMFVNSAVELALADTDINVIATEGFNKTEQLLLEIVTRGQNNGEFAKNVEPSELAEYLHNALTGLRVMVRTSVDQAKLRRIAELSMQMVKR